MQGKFKIRNIINVYVSNSLDMKYCQIEIHIMG